VSEEVRRREAEVSQESQEAQRQPHGGVAADGAIDATTSDL
jgi:hypothetical protein